MDTTNNNLDADQRMLYAINELGLAPKGSLWFVNDSVWKEAIVDFVEKRKAHPGLVFANKRYTSLIDIVPMMIGSSRICSHNRGFPVRDVMPGYRPQKQITYFTAIRPCGVLPLKKQDNSLAIDGFRGYNPNIQRNKEKLRIDVEEMEQLDAYLLQRGLHV